MKKIYKNVILGLILATILCFATFGTSYICADVKATEGENTETLPEEPVEEEKGFIERNFEQLIVTLTTDVGVFSAFLLFIIKANKTTKGILQTLSGQVEMSDGSAKKINKTIEKIDKSNTSLEKAVEDMKNNNAKVIDVITNIVNENKENFNGLENQFNKLAKAIALIVKNTDSLEDSIGVEIYEMLEGDGKNEEGTK